MRKREHRMDGERLLRTVLLAGCTPGRTKGAVGRVARKLSDHREGNPGSRALRSFYVPSYLRPSLSTIHH